MTVMYCLGRKKENRFRFGKGEYEMTIAEMMEKMIFGMKNQEVFDKVISAVEDYGVFMKEVNNLNESNGNYTVKQAIYIIENI